MENISSQITQIISKEFDMDIRPVITIPDPKFGDFSTNVALQLAGRLGRNPLEIAETIASKLDGATVAGSGFINVRLPDKHFIQTLNNINSDQNFGLPSIYKDQIVVTEYSDPNPFKVLHIGHLYTSIVGDAMSNLIEAAGGTTHRVNFGGDVGLHVAKTMYGIIHHLSGEHPEELDNIPESERSDWISARYVEGNHAYEDDEQAKSEIVELNKKVYSLFTTDDRTSPFAQIYWTCRQWSYDYFDAFYASIGVKFEKYYPESATAQIGLKTVKEQQKNGVYEESNGAVVFDGEKHGLHTRVFINSEGLPTYETKDLGLSFAKWDDYKFDQSIIITGNDITEYMKVLLKSIEQFRPDLSSKTLHLTHGMVKLAGGVKQSSRLGNFVKAVDCLALTREALKEQRGSVDEAVVLGAVKYAFLKNSVGPDIIFDPATSVSLQGNSGPYLQYSLTRAKSILRSIDRDLSEPLDHTQDLDEQERALIKKLSDFPFTLEKATKDLAPHHLCAYLYELAQVFNRFYENAKVAGDPRETLRAHLVQAYATVLSRGLSALGLPTPDKM